MSRLNLASTSLCVLLIVLSVPALAQSELGDIPFFDAEKGMIAQGAIMRVSSSLYLDPDNDAEERFIDFVPLYLYSGKYFFTRGTAAGVHVFDTKNVQLNLLLRYRFERLDPTRNAFYEGMEERKQSVDGGVEFRLRGQFGRLTANYLTDTLDRHNGDSAEISYFYDIKSGKLKITPWVGMAWFDSDLTNYYYGVREAEVRPDRPAYMPGESLRLNLGINTAYKVSRRTDVFMNAGMTAVDSVVSDSPLVAKDFAATLWLGANYTFGNIYDTSNDVSPGREAEWNWRVNFGYQANGNVFREIDQGELRKSEYADTRIGGLSVGRLLSNGRRVDFLAKAAILRHFEENEGNGRFNSYSAYIMARFKAYRQWTDAELFRYGIGFGVNYADSIPIHEQRKQDEFFDRTSNWLNYLELQLDVPLRNFTKAKSMRNCYAGVTVVHRSGFFGYSEMLGDVDGGSDWITLSFECTRGVN